MFLKEDIVYGTAVHVYIFILLQTWTFYKSLFQEVFQEFNLGFC